MAPRATPPRWSTRSSTQAFDYNNSNFGYASAQAMVLLLVVLVITAVQFGLLERKVFYR